MRLWARGPSGTFTASTPAALSARHCSSIGAGSTPLGGTISTLVTSSPLASFAPQHERADSGTSTTPAGAVRSEEHTSELQSQSNLVCRLLLEKKTNITITHSRHFQPIV